MPAALWALGFAIATLAPSIAAAAGSRASLGVVIDCAGPGPQRWLDGLGVGCAVVEDRGDTAELLGRIEALRTAVAEIYVRTARRDMPWEQLAGRVQGVILGPFPADDPAALRSWQEYVEREAPRLANAHWILALDRIDPSVASELEVPPGRSPWRAVAVPFTGEVAVERTTLAAFREGSPIPVWCLPVGASRGRDGNPVTDAENARDVVYRSVSAFAAGAEKVFWTSLCDDGDTGPGLLAGEGARVKPSHRALRVLGDRLASWESVKAVEEGSEVWAYRFAQAEGQQTTVMWAAADRHGLAWRSRIAGAPEIVDLFGSLSNLPNWQKLSVDPLYFVENRSRRFPRAPHAARSLPAARRSETFVTFPFPAIAAETPAPRFVDGWDWSLPEGIVPRPDTGFFFFTRGPEAPGDDIDVVGWHPYWREWHTGPGKYDFSSFEEALARARAGGYRISIRLQSVLRETVPDWLVEAARPPVVELSGPLRNRIVAPWHAGVRQEFETFVREFGRRGYAKDPAFAFASIHGISLASGEEFSLGAADLAQLERHAGLTPEDFARWVLGRLEAWADAFGGHSHKLAWVGAEAPFGVPAYDAVARRAIDLCFDRGIGARGGFIEMYNYKWNERIWGQSRDANGYLRVDERRMEQRPLFADENEEYVTVKRWRFGLLEEDSHRWRVSNMRALQMRNRYLATNGGAMDLDRQLSEYVRRALGRQVDDAPDAWCYLREAYVRGPEGTVLPLKNVERWLHQRDAAGVRTAPAARIERTYEMVTDPPEVRHEFDARRTDVASGNRAIGFELDDRFRAGPVVVKVTLTDDTSARWHIAYRDRYGAARRTPSVQGRGNGRVRTATFFLPDFAQVRAAEGTRDLTLEVEGREDIMVHLVRLIRDPAVARP